MVMIEFETEDAALNAGPISMGLTGEPAQLAVLSLYKAFEPVAALEAAATK